MSYSQQHQKLYPKEYLQGIDLFNDQEYWEAHEAWEGVWKISQGERKLFYQALIQAAAALLHYNKNNSRGAHLCINNSLKKLENLPSPYMSLDLVWFVQSLRDFLGMLIITDEAPISKNTDLEYPLIVLQE